MLHGLKSNKRRLMDISKTINFRSCSYRAVSHNNTDTCHSPVRKVLPCQVQKLLQSSLFIATEPVVEKTPVLHDLNRRYSFLVNRIALLFEEIYSNNEVSEEKMVHLQDMRGNLSYLQDELNQLAPATQKTHAIQQIEKAEELLEGTFLLAQYMPEYSTKVSVFDDAIEALIEKIYEPHEVSGPLLAIMDVKEAIERLEDVWETVQDSKGYPVVAEKMMELFAEDLRNFSWQIEDWAEVLGQSIDQERQVLARLGRGDQSEQAALQLQSLNTQLRKIGDVIGELLPQVKAFGSPECKKSANTIIHALQKIQKLAQTANKGPVNNNGIEYGSDEWQQLVDQRPQKKSGWLKALFQNVTQSENWSDTTKRIVYSVFIGMQLSEQVIGFTNKLHSIREEAERLHREALSQIPKEQMEQIDKEVAALGTLLSSKFGVLKESPESLEKLTKRYPEIRSILQESLKASKAPSAADINTITDAYRFQRILGAGYVSNPYAHLSLQEWWQLFTIHEPAKTVATKASPLLLSDIPWSEPAATAAKSSGVSSKVLGWVGRLWKHPPAEEEQIKSTQQQLKEDIVKTQKMNHQLVSQPPLEELRKEVALLHQELLRTIEHPPADMCPLVELMAWVKQVEEKCYAVKSLERRIEILMRAARGSLAIDDAELERCGKKHTNIVKQARLALALRIPGIQIPMPHGITNDTIQAFLQGSAPEVFEHWTALGELYSQYSGEGRFLEEPVAAQHLNAIDEAIVKAFGANEAFEALALSPEFISWQEGIKAAGNYLMVRSTGSEDSRQMANAGGNVSKAYVSPDPQPLCEALGDVVRSYFGYGSLQNRINAKQNPFEQELKLAVTCQELIGEAIGGSKQASEIPVSLVLFTDEPLYTGGETFRVMRISASYGHGEGVVGSQGIATDTVTLLISDAHPDQLYVLYDNKKKPERLAPVQGPNGITLEKVSNPPELQNKPALTPEMLARLYHWGIIGEKFFDGEATDMEIVIQGETIYPVQARPVNRLPLLPTYLDRLKLASAPESPLKASLQNEMLVPGRASAFSIANPDEILTATTLQEAERAFKEGVHRLVVVHQPEPANSHPVVNFSNLGIPCLLARDNDALRGLLKQISPQTPLIACMQTSSLHLWDSRKAKIEDFISSGFAVHPAKIAISMPMLAAQKMPNRRKEVPQEIKDFLVAIRDAQSKDAVLENLNHIEQHPWVHDIKVPKDPSEALSNVIQGRIDTVDAFASSFDAALAETRETIRRQPAGERLKSLFHVKVLESLLVGNAQKYGSINQYAVPDIWPTIEETQQLVDYQAQLPHPSKFIDLLLIGNQTFTPEAQASWRMFLLDLEAHAEQNMLPIEQIQKFKQMLQALERADLLPLWLSFHFSPSQETHPVVLERLAHLSGAVSDEDFASIDKQLSKKDDLQSLSDQIHLFTDPKTFDKAWEKLQQLASPQEQGMLAEEMKGVSAIAMAIAIKNMQQLVDLYDSAIKAMKASPQWTMKEKVPLFRTMLYPYLSLLKSWHQVIIDPTSIPVHSSWPISRYLSRLEELLNEHQSMDIAQLSPSRGFSVAAAVLGAITAFERHFPQTLEDDFTLYHQNLLVCTGVLNQRLFSDALIALSSLPHAFKAAARTIGALDPMKTSLEVNTNEVSLKYNIPLRNHSAGLTLSYNKEDDSLQLKMQLLGQARARWQQLRMLAELFDELKIIVLAQVPDRTDQELSLKCFINQPEQLDVTLGIFGKMFEMSMTDTFTDIRDLLRTMEIGDPNQVGLFDRFVKQIISDAEKGMKDSSLVDKAQAYLSFLDLIQHEPVDEATQTRVAEKGIVDSDESIRMIAYGIYCLLVNREEAFEAATIAVEKGASDPSTQIRQAIYSQLYPLLISKGQGYESAIRVAEKGVTDPDPAVRSAAYRLYGDLFDRGQGYESAIRVAEKGAADPDPEVKLVAFKLYQALVNKEQGYESAVRVAEKGAADPDRRVRSGAYNLYRTLFYKGQGHESAINMAEKGIADLDVERKLELYVLYNVLYYHNQGHDASLSKAAARGIADPNARVRSAARDLYNMLFNRGWGYESAIKAAEIGLTDADPEVRLEAYRLYQDLVFRGQGYESATKAAEKGITDPDERIKNFASSLYYSLVLKGQVSIGTIATSLFEKVKGWLKW